MKFNIDYRDYGRRDEERYSEDAYDYSWSEDHSYDYNSMTIVTDGYSDVALFPGEAEPKRGDTVHLVYVSYDSGDSFGREYGRHVQLWVFTNYERARALCDFIELDAKTAPDYDFDHKPQEFEGVPIATNEWKGYFEHFNCADTESVMIK